MSRVPDSEQWARILVPEVSLYRDISVTINYPCIAGLRSFPLNSFIIEIYIMIYNLYLLIKRDKILYNY